MTNDFSAVIEAPCFKLGLKTRGQFVEELTFLSPAQSPLPPQDAVAEQAAMQLAAYFADASHLPVIPRLPRGTTFQRGVWQAICNVPRGSTARYGELAARCGGHARAVGQACGANPYPIVVPCHRIVSTQGIGGFANARDGWLLTAKRWLLCHEGAI